MCSCLYFFVVSLLRWNWKWNYWIWCYVSCLIPGRVKWMCIKICYVNAVWIIYSRDSHGFPSFERLNSLCRICRRRPKRCSDSKPTIDLYEAVGKVCVWTYTMDSPCTSQCCHVLYLLCVYGMYCTVRAPISKYFKEVPWTPCYKGPWPVLMGLIWTSSCAEVFCIAYYALCPFYNSALVWYTLDLTCASWTADTYQI